MKLLFGGNADLGISAKIKKKASCWLLGFLGKSQRQILLTFFWRKH